MKMRKFVVVGHRAVTSPDFNLSDLSGSAGRMDILARAVAASFFLSHEIRKDVLLYLLLLGEPSPPKSLKFVGSELKYLNPDERSTAALIRNALSKNSSDDGRGNENIAKDEERTEEWLRSTPGIYISGKNLESLLRECEPSAFYYLEERGEDIRGMNIQREATFILGDDRDLDEEEERALERFKPKVINLGPLSLHTEHCITLVHNEMDRKNIR